MGFRVAPEQRDRYEDALGECTALVDDAVLDLAPSTGSGYYEALVAARECLVAEGSSLPQPPSLDRFLESLAGGEPPWSPYLDLPDSMTQERWNAMLAACPQPVGT